MGKYQKSKDLVRDYFNKLENCPINKIEDTIKLYTSENYTWKSVYPFIGGEGVYDIANRLWKQIKESLGCLQRRQDVFMGGDSNDGNIWIMSMGQFVGLFDKDFLGIRHTRKMQHLQYYEFNRVEDGKITHTSIFIDIIGFMKEANQYPLCAETGHYFVYPGPKDHNGLLFNDEPDELLAKTKAEQSLEIVNIMGAELESINGTNKHPRDMLEKSWTNDMIWYGPCGVGASYTIPRYQEQHQIPFRTRLLNISSYPVDVVFAEGDFVCLYGSLDLTPIGGWLGMPGGDKDVHLYNDVDVYYCKDGKISENWCFFDIPYWLHQQGCEIISRYNQIENMKVITE